MLFDWLVSGQIVPANPADAVRGPRHAVSKGATPVLSSEEATALLTGMDVSTVVGPVGRLGLHLAAFFKVLPQQVRREPPPTGMCARGATSGRHVNRRNH